MVRGVLAIVLPVGWPGCIQCPVPRMVTSQMPGTVAPQEEFHPKYPFFPPPLRTRQFQSSTSNFSPSQKMHLQNYDNYPIWFLYVSGIYLKPPTVEMVSFPVTMLVGTLWKQLGLLSCCTNATLIKKNIVEVTVLQSNQVHLKGPFSWQSFFFFFF